MTHHGELLVQMKILKKICGYRQEPNLNADKIFGKRYVYAVAKKLSITHPGVLLAEILAIKLATCQISKKYPPQSVTRNRWST